MPLTRTDLKDAALLLKAGKIDHVRQILGSSRDPRAVALLAKLNARLATAQKNEIVEIKQLIQQKRFAEAEAMLRASNHPKAGYLLEQLTLKISTPKATVQAEQQPPKQTVFASMFVVLSRVGQKAKGVFQRGSRTLEA